MGSVHYLQQPSDHVYLQCFALSDFKIFKSNDQSLMVSLRLGGSFGWSFHQSISRCNSTAPDFWASGGPDKGLVMLASLEGYP